MTRYRSMLFVPGDRPDRIQKAMATAADLVCIDLEDAVTPAAKDEARDEVTRLLAGGAAGQRAVAVRLNHPATLAGLADLVALVRWEQWPDLVVLPKVESPGEAALVVRLLREAGSASGVMATIESLAGLRHAAAIAAVSGVAGLMFGGFDFAAEAGVTPAWEPLLLARQQIVLAAASSGLPVLDVPYVNFRDTDGLRAEAERVRALGFTGKAAIHPDQVPTINTAFSPTETEIRWARSVLAAARSPRGAVAVAGQLVDAAVCRRAEGILALVRDENPAGAS